MCARMSRPFKKIWGIAYKDVIPGDNPTKDITAPQDDREALYNDLAIRLSEADFGRFKSLVGKPICREHDPNVVLGHIHGYDISKDDGHLRIMARVFTDTDEGRQAADQLERGELNGLSVGYTTNMVKGTTKVASKSFNELTLTEAPFFDGCYVSVQASRKEKKNLASKESTYNTEVLWIKLSKENSTMSDQTTPPPTIPTPTPADVAPTLNAPPGQNAQHEASSLLKVADGLQEQVNAATATAATERAKADELRTQSEADARELAELRAYRAADKAAYAESQKAEAEVTLKTHEEMRGQAFAPNVQQAMIETMCSKEPRDLQATEILCSQAKAYTDQREGKLKAEAEIKALREQLAKQGEEVEIAQQRINASQQGVRDLYAPRVTDSKGKQEEDTTTTGLDVEASRGSAQYTGNMAPDTFFPMRGNTSTTINMPKASPMELNLPYFNQQPAETLQVTASRGAGGASIMTVNRAPRNPQTDELHYSMRNARNSQWFDMMVHQKDLMMRGPPCVLRSDNLDRQRKEPDWSTMEKNQE